MVIHFLKNNRTPLRPSQTLPFNNLPEFSESLAELYALAQSRFGSLLSNNPYALLPDTLNFLSELMAHQQPSTIMEFGSGESTYNFASWAVANNSHVVSVENDKKWVNHIKSIVPDNAKKALSLLHAPLRIRVGGIRLFFTYKSLDTLNSHVTKARLILIDGPHLSGREVVLYLVLNSCQPSTLIVIDDFNLSPVRDMLASVPKKLADCFAGVAIENNSHGLYILRCEQLPEPATLPVVSFLAIARSYWRCLLDYQKYGTGDS